MTIPTDEQTKEKFEEKKEEAKVVFSGAKAYFSERKVTMMVMAIIGLIGFATEGIAKCYVHAHPIKAMLHGIVLSQLEWKIAGIAILLMVCVAIIGRFIRSAKE